MSGSSNARPYAQEIPALINKILDIHYNKHLQDFHPVVADILLMMNFCLFMMEMDEFLGCYFRLLCTITLLIFEWRGHFLVDRVLPVNEKRFFSHFTQHRVKYYNTIFYKLLYSFRLLFNFIF